MTAQEARIYSNAEITNFWNRVLITKRSDTTLTFLAKAILFAFLTTPQEHLSVFYSPSNRNRFNPYGVFRVGLCDHLLNISPLFAPYWLADVQNYFKICFSCYILTQGGIYFPNFLFVQHVFTFHLSFYNSISIKYSFHEDRTLLSSPAHRFSIYTTSIRFTDLQDVELDKRQRKSLRRLVGLPENSSQLVAGKVKSFLKLKFQSSCLKI